MLNKNLDPGSFTKMQDVRRGIAKPVIRLLRKGQRVARFAATRRPRSMWEHWAGSPWWVRREVLVHLWRCYTDFFPEPMQEERPFSDIAISALQLEKNDAEVVVVATVLEDINVFAGLGSMLKDTGGKFLVPEFRGLPRCEQLYIPDIVDANYRLNHLGRQALGRVGFLFV
jgi:hypothetical protein